MPTMEKIERDRTVYVNEMKAYLYNLKSMDRNEARKKAFQNLVQCEIICENGELVDRYKISGCIVERMDKSEKGKKNKKMTVKVL